MKISDFAKYKKEGRKISMISAYDFGMAQIIDDSPIDCILVGDTLAMLQHGFESTVHATMEMMELHTAAVARGAPGTFIIGDLPFLSYRKTKSEGIENMGRLMRAGACAIKLEGASGNLELISHAVQSGIPIMGHLGLTPQSVNTLGGFKVQGKNEETARRIIEDAKALETAGCFALVLECVPAELACMITESLEIATIGIGAGSGTDGQVLVLPDMLGLNPSFNAKFLRKYLDGYRLVREALEAYHQDVVEIKYPSEKESYACK